MYAAMLLADARLPTGGHAFSAGVEPALRGGLSPERVRELMIGRATTTSLVEAGTAVVARRVVAARDSRVPAALAAVERAWAARTPAAALRETSREQARGYLRLGRRLWPRSAALTAVGRIDRPSRGVVLGALAVELELDPTALVRLVIYDEAAAAAAALLKLDPRDPADVSGWVLEACAAGEPHVAAVAALTDPADIPANGAPQTEGWAQAHAASTRRLFRA
ncbi:urease accessory UreF family protein [Gordonia alkaliphila]|uniref:Urease accessory UreF family protein n=1 Tax=Gordonia alkaliphila TaxID=1053547 RepID=A0ABP8ZDX0_9ACTN